MQLFPLQLSDNKPVGLQLQVQPIFSNLLLCAIWHLINKIMKILLHKNVVFHFFFMHSICTYRQFEFAIELL